MTDRNFGRDNRLIDPKSYRRVVTGRHRGTRGALRWHARTNDTGVARLGITVPKRHVKRAVDRNRIKRVVRDSFRHNKCRLEARDVVISIRGRIDDERNLRVSLDKIWGQIAVC